MYRSTSLPMAFTREVVNNSQVGVEGPKPSPSSVFCNRIQENTVSSNDMEVVLLIDSREAIKS